MIFFGSKGKVVPGPVIEGMQCPNCEGSQFVTFGMLRYFHLYWIPTFITSKSVGMECTHCKKALVDKELPEDLSKNIRGAVFNKKNTLPMFAGLMIIACLGVFSVIAAQRNQMIEAGYIEQPLVDDLYIVDFTELFTESDPQYKYGVMRIMSVYSDQVQFQASTIAYNKTSGVRQDIRKHATSEDSYYGEESLYINIDQLKELKESGAIYAIERI